LLLLVFPIVAGRIGATGTTNSAGDIGILAGGDFPLTIESSSGKKCTDGDDRQNNYFFNHD